jgi:hypothetical protein
MGRTRRKHEKMRNTCKIFSGRTERTRLLGRPRHRLEDEVKTNVKNVMWGCGLFKCLRTLVNMIINVWVPLKAGNFVTSCL